MPEEIRERCRHADITSKSMLLQIVRQPDEEAMGRLVDKIAAEGITREEARRFNRKGSPRGRNPRRFVYRFAPVDREFQFTLTFSRPQVERGELITTLQRILGQLLEEGARGASSEEAVPDVVVPA